MVATKRKTCKQDNLASSLCTARSAFILASRSLSHHSSASVHKDASLVTYAALPRPRALRGSCHLPNWLPHPVPAVGESIHRHNAATLVDWCTWLSKLSSSSSISCLSSISSHSLCSTLLWEILQMISATHGNLENMNLILKASP